MKKTTITLALSTLLPFSVQATNKPLELVITAKGEQTLADVAATSHVITAEQIEKSHAQDLTELINAISGISIARNGGRGSVSSTFIRGAASNQTVIIVDGIRVGSATLGFTDLGHIPIDIIDRIEVVKGPLSGLYGADAIGGVIQIFTKKGGIEAKNVSLIAGSFGHQKLTANLSNQEFRLSVSREENDGIDATKIATGGNEDKDGFEETAVSFAYSHDINENTKATFSLFNTNNEIEFDNLFGIDTGYFTKNDITNIALNVDTKTGSGAKWSTTVGYTKNDANTPAFAIFNSSRFDTKRLSLTSQGQYSLKNNAKLIVGADYYQEDINTDADFAETSRHNVGLFTQYQQDFSTIGLVGNLRIDDNSAYGNNTNGSLALSVPINASTRFTAMYGTAFRAPTFNELYFPFAGNADIQPEESDSFELSLRGSHENLAWRISAYDTQIKNLIEFPAPNFVATNTSEASLQGLELELNAKLDEWTLSTSLNLLDAKNDTTGEELIRRPEQTFKLGLSRKFNKSSLSINLSQEKGRYELGQELDSFTLIGISTSHQIAENFKVTTKIGNLLDKDYQLASGFNTEGFSFMLGGKITF